MTDVSPLEQELIDATGFKGPKKAKRQDFLAGLVRATVDLDQDTFDNLSDEAAEWAETGVKALNDKEDIAEFVEPEEAEEPADEDETDTDHEADEAAADKKARAKPNGTDTDEEEELDPTDDNPEDDEPEHDPEAIKAAAKARKADKKAKSKEVTDQYAAITGEKNRYGITKGTMSDKAIAMYEKGATSKQIKDELGGRHYNILKRLQDEGHKVEKLEGGQWKLTHHADLKTKKATTKK